MLIFINVISFMFVAIWAGTLGWLGESVQFYMTKHSDVNSKYDREVLLSLALIQAGKGEANFDSGFIELKTDGHWFKIYGTDYCSEQFGECYSHRINYGEWRRADDVDGTLSLKTRKYLRDFKESYLGIVDPSSKKGFTFKKEKVTIE